MSEASSPTNFIRQIIDEDLASGKHKSVHTRFPPEPNGYLHIGHAKSICLNFGIARDYQGQCNLRFDDTNPAKEDIEFVESIKQDVQWLGFQWSGEICYSSDYFDKLHGYAIELIEKGLAYVDELSPEQMREYRGTLTAPGKNSPFRDRSVEENLALFAKMKSGEMAEGSACLRAKIDMASPFMVMRDPVIYRIKFAHHHQTGDKWCIYPMYDFTHCISDALEGITHSLCTLEFQDNRRLYDWVLDNISIDCHPRQYEFSRLNLEYTVMSKRKLNLLVTEGHVSGWDDPRMLTVSGLRRRGYTPASIREFCQRIGVTKQDNIVEMSMLEACIRDDLNENAPRAMAVLHPVKVVIENYPEDQVEEFEMPWHPEDAAYGSRTVPFSRELWIERDDFQEVPPPKYFRLSPGREVRLRGAYFVTATDVIKDLDGRVVQVNATYDPQTRGGDSPDGRKVKSTMHWVSAPHAWDATVNLYDRLFATEVPGAETGEPLDDLNPASRETLRGAKLEAALADAEPGEVVQFERLGYFAADPDLPGLFHRTVGLRDEWAAVQKRS